MNLLTNLELCVEADRRNILLLTPTQRYNLEKKIQNHDKKLADLVEEERLANAASNFYRLNNHLYDE